MPHKTIDSELLKLRFAGYSTRQIYELLSSNPDYFDLTPKEKMTNLRHFSNHTTSRYAATYYHNYCTLNVEQIRRKLAESNIEIISIFHPLYPKLLKNIYDPPLILFCKGNLDLLRGQNYLSIVGSREATSYTEKALKVLMADLSLYPFVIVSGLAKGGDCFAHQAALHHHMPTIGVLAFGHYHHYPKETKAVRSIIERKGLTISEYIPSDPPKKYKFPERNRIISGLAQGVMITESRERSGAQITVDLALEQNRNVYVLPGSLFQSLTRGNLKRAQEGAKIVLCAQDIIEDYQQIE